MAEKGKGREGHGRWQRRAWEMAEKGMGDGREGHGRWQRRAWEMAEKGMGDGREGHWETALHDIGMEKIL